MPAMALKCFYYFGGVTYRRLTYVLVNQPVVLILVVLVFLVFRAAAGADSRPPAAVLLFAGALGWVCLRPESPLLDR